MKKIILFSGFLLAITISASAKKLKFAVDMTGLTINPTGVHVYGDFQLAAGYSGDWIPNLTPMVQEGATDIYSVVVDVPGFTKYEFRFLNGDQTYDTEIIPWQSQVGYNFDDNRWVYVDSVSNDTMFFGAIRFGGNAPAGLSLIRFVVDMQNESSVAAEGVHVAGDYQLWDASKNRLYSFGSDIYEIINYVSNGNYEFQYFNGNTSGTAESVPGACSTNNHREIAIANDTVLSTLCFSGCSVCSLNGIAEIMQLRNVKVFPNPAVNFAQLEFADANIGYSVFISDYTGRLVRSYPDVNEKLFRIEKENLNSGIYFIRVANKRNELVSSSKLILE